MSAYLASLAVLCDLDGVLVDSGPAILRTWRRFAERHGLEPAVVERTIHGRPASASVRLLAPGSAVAAETQLLDEWELRDLEGVRPLPGAAALQGLLGDERLAVVTSCRADLAKARLRAAGLAVPRVLVTRESVRLGKPSPECYLLAAARLGFEPSECAAIEDSPIGLAAGKAAGAMTIAVTTTFPAAELDADVVVGALSDLVPRFRPTR